MAGIISPEVVAVRRRFIAAKYKADQRDKRSPKPSFSRSSHRVRELERLYRLRWGCYLPDDDAGRDDLVLAFNQIARSDACIEWAARWAPWLAHAEAAALAEQITTSPKWLKAGPLGELLGLTDAERTALDIRTIRPIDLTEDDLVERRRRKDRERKALERKQARATKPAPASQTRPWEAEGISRATWYRQRAKPRETKKRPQYFVYYCGRNLSHHASGYRRRHPSRIRWRIEGRGRSPRWLPQPTEPAVEDKVSDIDAPDQGDESPWPCIRLRPSADRTHVRDLSRLERGRSLLFERMG